MVEVASMSREASAGRDSIGLMLQSAFFLQIPLTLISYSVKAIV